MRSRTAHARVGAAWFFAAHFTGDSLFGPRGPGKTTGKTIGKNDWD
jgi:hypothetical protein